LSPTDGFSLSRPETQCAILRDREYHATTREQRLLGAKLSAELALSRFWRILYRR
jgi:hypothetical protein